MGLCRLLIVTLLLAISLNGYPKVLNPTESYYRNIWSPTYHGQRLNYCTLDGKECGLAVAHQYCQMLGYKRADKAVIAYNVGLTHFLSNNNARCKGWRCNGFMLITCVGAFSHHPAEAYYYRSSQFEFPRFDHYRVAWCYENNSGCGKRAAHSFCRRMGYRRAQYYKKQDHVTATKALGNQKLCFGEGCSGFRHIMCYR